MMLNVINFKRCALFLLLLATSKNAIADYAVIINRDNQSKLSNSLVSKIFLGKIKKFPDGVTVLPINHPDESKSKIDFDAWFIGKTPSQMQSYWAQVIFSGKAVPIKTVATDDEVVDIVSRTPGGIGYVKEIYADERVKIIFRY